MGDNMPVILCGEKPDFKYDLRSIAADYCVVKESNLSELKSIIGMVMETDIPFRDIRKSTGPLGRIPLRRPHDLFMPGC